MAGPMDLALEEAGIGQSYILVDAHVDASCIFGLVDLRCHASCRPPPPPLFSACPCLVDMGHKLGNEELLFSI